MKKLVTIIVSILACLVVLSGCGAKDSADKQKAQEAITAYESYRNEDISSDEAMQQILKLSAEIENKEIANRVAKIVALMAFEEMNGTDGTEKHIDELKDYLENGATSASTGGNEQVTPEETPEDILREANEFLADCWNPVCDLDWYLSNGTSSTGGDLDPEFTVAKFQDAYKKRDEISAKVDGLSDTEYALAKQAFTKAVKEFDRINGILDETSFLFVQLDRTTLEISTLQDYVRTFSDQAWDATH